MRTTNGKRWSYVTGEKGRNRVRTFAHPVTGVHHISGNARDKQAIPLLSPLVTDAKPNLGDLFDLDRELLAYETPDECASLLG